MLIPLTGGGFAEVDDIDSGVAIHKWKCKTEPGCRTRYAVATIAGKLVRMHRLILGATPLQRIDHRDCNGLNNKRDNLRFATTSQNMANVIGHKNNTSGFKGVHKVVRRYHVAWRAEITVQGKRHILGQRKNINEAVKLYDDAALKYFGEFARTNRPAT